MPTPAGYPTQDWVDFDEDAYWERQRDLQQDRWEHEGEQLAGWGELGDAAPAVRAAFWDARDARGDADSQSDITWEELDAAYIAAGEEYLAAMRDGVDGPETKECLK